jgi:hypothetical protein
MGRRIGFIDKSAKSQVVSSEKKNKVQKRIRKKPSSHQKPVRVDKSTGDKIREHGNRDRASRANQKKSSVRVQKNSKAQKGVGKKTEICEEEVGSSSTTYTSSSISRDQSKCDRVFSLTGRTIESITPVRLGHSWILPVKKDLFIIIVGEPADHEKVSPLIDQLAE